MLDIVFGSSGQGPSETMLREEIQKLEPTGTLYFSYPIFADTDGQSSADALLVSDEHGLVVFDLSASPCPGLGTEDWLDEIENRQDEIYRNIQARLLLNKDLVHRRNLVIDLGIVTVVPDLPEGGLGNELMIATPEVLPGILSKLGPLPQEHKRALNATIQRVTTIKPKTKRDNVQTSTSYGYVLREIERKIANLDAWQKSSAIAYPEGPQRIRGLAGSGKTIVLALKAAYLHATHPNWNIAVSYYSRAMRQQLRDLIRRFMFETKRDEPDWSKIHVLHSWGSRSESGVYSEISRAVGMEPVSWRDANNRYGIRSFDGICKEVLKRLDGRDLEDSLYDAVLIDEAQDLPASFFRLVYAATSTPKRIVWAYDELQNLGDYAMSSPAELFGKNKNGDPRVVLTNEPNRPPQDIILRVCYRNTPWALTVAHGLGFGVYREASDKSATPMVQMFDDPNLWTEIGYESRKGELAVGNKVSLRRHPDSTPEYYADPESRLIEPDEAVCFQSFGEAELQAKWIAKQIKNDLGENELLHQDILIVLPNAWTAKSEYGLIARALRKQKIASHLVGTTSSRDQVFQKDSVAVTHIYRAKGNEAPMVYFANSHECYDGLELAKKRNVLFTGITRSRAWVRVCGVGEKSTRLKREFQKVVDAQYNLDFEYPSVEEISQIRKIHRDRSDEEQRKINKRITEFSSVIEMIRSGEVSVGALPDELIDELRSILPRR